MSIPSTIADLSTTAASNSPSGSEAIGTSLDDYLRAIQAIVKSENSKGSDIASATTITIPNVGEYFVVTGSVAITTIADSWTGRLSVLKFSSTPTLTNSAGLILPSGANITAAAGDCAGFVNESTGVWRCVFYQKAAGYIAGNDIQSQAYTAFTSAGTAPTFTLTPSPAITSYTANQRFRVKFHAIGAGSDTLNVSGLGAKSIKYVDSIGTKQAFVPISGFLADVEYDGTDMVVLNPVFPQVTSTSVPVRQTVLSGPVDSSGFSAFGGSTGSTTVTASGTLKATAAAGGDANYTGSITNPSWTGLSTNGTMYLYLDITSGGVVTTGSTTLAPVYQWGGTYSTTNLQNTFNIQEMTMKMGNGSTASQVYRVFVGEVTVAGGVTTAIVWYALMGRYDSGWTSTLPGAATSISKNHNLGVVPYSCAIELKCLTAEANFAVGDIINPYTGPAGSFDAPFVISRTSTVIQTCTGATSAFVVNNRTAGTPATLTAANWAYRFTANRGIW